MKKNIVVVIIIITLIIIGLVLLFYYYKNQKPTSTDQQKNNLNYISDESLGISFSIDKKLLRIDQKELVSQNPFFIYGFHDQDVKEVSCYISQNKMPQAGKVISEYLKDGVYDQIKKNIPDASLDNWREINMGDNIKGAWLEMSYKDGKANFKQIEIVGTNEKTSTFAFCIAPASLYQLYQEKFKVFLNSVKIW